MTDREVGGWKTEDSISEGDSQSSSHRRKRENSAVTLLITQLGFNFIQNFSLISIGPPFPFLERFKFYNCEVKLMPPLSKRKQKYHLD